MFAIIVTNLLDRPNQGTEKTKLSKIIANNAELVTEGFQFKLKVDNMHVRDYYFMAELERIIKYCSENPNIKKVQLLWPHSNGVFTHEGRRMKNMISHMSHIGYALWQRGVQLSVVGQPEVGMEEIDLFCNATFVEAEPKIIKEKLNLDLIKLEQNKDEKIQKILKELKSNEKLAEEYWVKDEMLFKIDTKATRDDTACLCIPDSLVDLVLKLHHDQSAHPGMAKTNMQCKSQIYWPSMVKDIQKYISKCIICVQAKCSVNRKVMSTLR